MGNTIFNPAYFSSIVLKMVSVADKVIAGNHHLIRLFLRGLSHTSFTDMLPGQRDMC